MQEEHAKERSVWSQREESLRQENSELRAQLLYALSQLSQPSTISTKEDDILDGRAAAGSLPSPGGHQVKAVMDAVKQQSLPAQGPPPAAAASPGSPSPAWASELAAAIAAVDEVDILHQDVDYNAMGRRSADISPSLQPQPATLQPPVQQPQPLQQQQQISGQDDGSDSQQKGPPPPLSLGADDIFWVNQLHTALVDAGFYPGDEDIDDFYFGDSTQSAVLSFQACSSLSETGAVDDATWRMLLGNDLSLKQSRDLTEDQFMDAGEPSSSYSSSSTTTSSMKSVVEKKPFAEFFRTPHQETTVVNQVVEDDAIIDGHSIEERENSKEISFVEVKRTSIQHTSSVAVSSVSRDTWPTLIDGDGGRDVHSLHVALQNAGYSTSEDDTRWWQFGDSTMNALKTFQACNGLPESGVCDAITWMALLGKDATPNDLGVLVSGDSDDEDLGDTQGKVWLIGEQRWEDRKKLKRE